MQYPYSNETKIETDDEDDARSLSDSDLNGWHDDDDDQTLPPPDFDDAPDPHDNEVA